MRCVSYQTAWLKAHHPDQFMAAVLSADMQHTDKIVTLVDEVRQAELSLDPPDINLSRFRFSVRDGRILYGLGAIRGIGEGAVIAICDSREQQGAFRRPVRLLPTDRCRRRRIGARRGVDPRRRDGWICAHRRRPRCGAWPAARGTRQALQGAEQVARNAASGIDDLFGGPFRRALRRRLRSVASGATRRARAGVYASRTARRRKGSARPVSHGTSAGRLSRRNPRVLSESHRRSEGRARRAGAWRVSWFDSRTMRSDAAKRWRSRCSTIAAAGSNCRCSPMSTNSTSRRSSKTRSSSSRAKCNRTNTRGALKMRVAQIHTMDEARRRFADCLQIEVCGDGCVARLCAATEDAARTASSRRLSGCDRVPLAARPRVASCSAPTGALRRAMSCCNRCATSSARDRLACTTVARRRDRGAGGRSGGARPR